MCNLTNKQPMEDSSCSPNAHAIRNSNRHARKNKYIDAGNVTKYNNLHTQESFDKKILTLPNFPLRKFGAASQSDTS